MQGFEFNTVGRIINGLGSAMQLAAQCRQLGVERPLLVTDPGLMAIGLVQPVLSALQNEGLSTLVFDQVREDPPEATVLAAAEMARNGNVDGVIAVGGGSSMVPSRFWNCPQIDADPRYRLIGEVKKILCCPSH